MITPSNANLRRQMNVLPIPAIAKSNFTRQDSYILICIQEVIVVVNVLGISEAYSADWTTVFPTKFNRYDPVTNIEPPTRKCLGSNINHC